MNPRLHPTTAQAIALYEAAHIAQAERVLEAYLKRERKDPYALALMAQILFDRGRLPQCEFSARQAMALAPGFPAPLIVLARALWAQNRSVDALPVIKRATEIEPGSFQAWAALGHIHAALKNYEDAFVAYERSLAIDSVHNEAAIQGLAQTYGHVGQREKAMAVLRAGCTAQPANPRMAAEYACTLNYVSGVSAIDVAQAHAEIGRRLAMHPRPALPPPAFNPDPHKRLRIGLLSGDLRQHPVAFFLEPILAHRDATAVEFVVFSTRVERDDDAWTDRIRKHTVEWCSLIGTEESESCPRIMSKHIDILIDLAGHTNATGVWLMRNRLAPLQITYLGYPNTTGIIGVDCRLVSTATDPAGYEAFATERLLRLDPCMHGYVPPPDAPEPRTATARRPGPIRFGSFNNVGKVSAQTLDLWARVLTQTPGSTLVLKSETIGEAPSWRFIIDALASRAVDPSRVSPLARVKSFAEHLALYHDVDIALDTVPYNGTTTTCEALWMGVPVVAMWGDRHGARVGGALLHAAGTPELVADTADGYVELASTLAGDQARREQYRAQLRAQVAASVLCDGPAMARRFEGALRGAWRELCASYVAYAAGAPPQAR